MLVNETSCTGCGACADVCPRTAITMKCGELGFLFPKVDDSKCIGCNRCSCVCPVINTEIHVDSVKRVFAAFSLNESIRYNSTSGGIFSEIALSILENGGIVVGATYKDGMLVEHRLCNSEKDIVNLRQSKYLQSEKINIYKQIGVQLRNNKKVLFIGTPCECHALLSYLSACRIADEHLIIGDFICRGANSPKVFQMYIKELEDKYNSPVKRVWFKNKIISWSEFSTRIEFENGEVYSKTREEDYYIKGYIEGCLYVRESCYRCQFKGKNRQTDFTLGDFWGIDKLNPKLDCRNGVSMLMINSQKGIDLLDSLKNKLYLEEYEYADVLKGNGCIEKSVEKPIFYKYFRKHLEKDGYFATMNSIYNESLFRNIYCFKEKALRRIKRLFCASESKSNQHLS